MNHLHEQAQGRLQQLAPNALDEYTQLLHEVRFFPP